MDHGLDIETRVRAGPARASASGSTSSRSPPTTCTTRTQTDADAHEVLLCVQSGSTMADPKRFKFDARDFYLKSAARDARAVGRRGARRLRQHAGDRREDRRLRDAVRVAQPDAAVPGARRGRPRSRCLRKEVARGLAAALPGRRAGGPRGSRPSTSSTSSARWASPATSWSPPTSCAYAKQEGIRVGPGRGSAAGALIAYALGITELDPIAHGLLFERFLNPDRVSMPDIDMDFDERRRGDMIRYATEKYGEERVAQIITYGTIKAKAAIKDAARVLGYPFAMGDRITKAMPPPVMGKDIPLGRHLRPEPPALPGGGRVPRALRVRRRTSQKVVDTAKGLEGLKRQWGVHAAGVILSRDPLLDVLPIQKREQDGAIITQCDMGACESLGLLKMDFLGLRNLTVMDDCLSAIKANRGDRPGPGGPAARRQGDLRAAGPRRHARRVPARRRADARRCCARWRPTTSRTSPRSARSTGPARWAPTRTTTTPTARTTASRWCRSTPSWPSRWTRSSATPTA